MIFQKGKLIFEKKNHASKYGGSKIAYNALIISTYSVIRIMEKIRTVPFHRCQ